MAARLISHSTTPKVYVVTEFFPKTDRTPQVNLFENEKSAKQYIEYLKETGHTPVCSLAKLPVFYEVKIVKEEHAHNGHTTITMS